VVVVRGFFYSQPDWHHRQVRVVHRPVYVQRNAPHVAPGRWEHRPPTSRPYVRVPESQRKPIVQQHQPMPAANGFSQHRDRPQREQRAVEPRRQSDQTHNQRGREFSRDRGGHESRGGGRGEQRGPRG
jgi:hypothetical protein